jgi:hypothetical protein
MIQQAHTRLYTQMKWNLYTEETGALPGSV